MSVKLFAKILLYVLFLILFLPLAKAGTSPILEHEKVVLKYVELFNQKNIQRMLSHTSEQVLWMNVSDDKILVETKGQRALRQALESYFKSTPSIYSEILNIQSTGPFVYTVEKAHWKNNGKAKSQCSPAIYQLEDKQITHVWYFPAYAC